MHDEFKLLFVVGNREVYSYQRAYEGEFLVFDGWDRRTITRIYGEKSLIEFLAGPGEDAEALSNKHSGRMEQCQN